MLEEVWWVEIRWWGSITIQIYRLVPWFLFHIFHPLFVPVAPYLPCVWPSILCLRSFSSSSCCALSASYFVSCAKSSCNCWALSSSYSCGLFLTFLWLSFLSFSFAVDLGFCWLKWCWCSTQRKGYVIDVVAMNTLLLYHWKHTYLWNCSCIITLIMYNNNIIQNNHYIYNK